VHSRNLADYADNLMLIIVLDSTNYLPLEA